MAITYHAGRRIQAVPDEYKVHTFTTTGNSTFTVTGSGNVEYLIIAGGGAGGLGGGGAGGYRTATGHAVTAQSYSITVGAGGVQTGGYDGSNNGSNSTFDTITSTGGGYGGRNYAQGNNGANGGSGGGGGSNNSTNTDPTGGISSPVTSPVQGYAGGGGIGTANGYPNISAGGGGGSSSIGGSGSGNIGGNGGSGTSSSITGSAVIRAGGGGGFGVNGGAGGSGGGGSYGGGGSGIGGAGAVNTGSGGGGTSSTTDASGSGGSGIVIIRYKTSSGITATGGTITTINDHDDRPTDVQEGSRLEETDTRKMYHYEPELSLTGLKAHYDFSQTSGNLLNVATNTDSLGSSGDLTTTGTITKTAGAWVFGGGSAQNTTNALPSTFTAFTMNMWIQPNANNTSGYALVLSAVDGNTNNFSTINGNSSGKWQPTVGAYAGSEAISYTTSNMDSSAFQMVTLVYNGALSGTARMQVYFNGSAEGTPTATPVASATASSKICVAIQGNSGQTPIFLGTYKDVSIWDRALTGSEITKLYNAGTAISPSGIFAWKELGT